MIENLQDGETDFCYICRKETKYHLQKENFHHMIDGKEYVIPITEAICEECGSYMDPPGLMNLNTNEYINWYEMRFGVKPNR